MRFLQWQHHLLQQENQGRGQTCDPVLRLLPSGARGRKRGVGRQLEGLRLMVAAGHADTQNACGVQVRPLTEAQDAEAGTSVRGCQTGSIPVGGGAST